MSHNAKKIAVELSKNMLSGKTKFLDGAVQMASLRWQIEGVDESDTDFTVFVVIASETDELPLTAHRHLWNREVLDKLQNEIDDAENWAKKIAYGACENIISRFSEEQSKNQRHIKPKT